MHCIQKSCTSSANVEFAGYNTEQSHRHNFAIAELYATCEDATLHTKFPSPAGHFTYRHEFYYLFSFPDFKGFNNLC